MTHPASTRASTRARMQLRSTRLLTLTTLASLASLAVVSLAPESARAVATRLFEIDDAATFAQGELHHAAVRSTGEVVASVGLERIALPTEANVAWSWARGADGALYVGTGDDGRIYRVRGSNVELFAETHQLLVTSLVLGDGGVLYAGTTPEGRIFAIPTTGTPAVRELVRPGAPATTAAAPGVVDTVAGTPVLSAEGTETPPPATTATRSETPAATAAESVWDLAWDAARHRLYAATGPYGQVFSIDPQGHADVVWDAAAAHVMSLALAPDGTLYAGTNDDAIVAAISPQGQARIAWDFPGNEITSLAFRDGVLAVAANELPEPPAPAAAPTKRTATGARAARPRPGKGRVWTLGADGRAERVWAQEDAHVTRLQLAEGGVVFAALAAEGRVVRIQPDRSSSVWIDVDERQVLALDLASASPFIATGDAAALYRVESGRPSEPQWTSKVLDAEQQARWGQLVWRSRGSVRFETRSGNTERPDATWSAWSSALSAPGPIRSAAGRFLQLRATLEGDASLRAVQVYYLPQNQRPVVSDVGLKARTTKRAPDADPTAPPTPSTSVGLAWRVENVDADRVRYRVRFREEGQTLWREATRETDALTATEYQWNTAALPDGYYVIAVEASDELSNPTSYTLRSTAESEPILVDNTPPEVRELRAAGTHVTGVARDALGPILRLEVAIDGGEWRLVFPSDDLFDTREERFDVEIPLLSTATALAPGPHLVAVRAFDAAGNSASSELTWTLEARPPRDARPPR